MEYFYVSKYLVYRLDLSAQYNSLILKFFSKENLICYIFKQILNETVSFEVVLLFGISFLQSFIKTLFSENIFSACYFISLNIFYEDVIKTRLKVQNNMEYVIYIWANIQRFQWFHAYVFYKYVCIHGVCIQCNKCVCVYNVSKQTASGCAYFGLIEMNVAVFHS